MSGPETGTRPEVYKSGTTEPSSSSTLLQWSAGRCRRAWHTSKTVSFHERTYVVYLIRKDHMLHYGELRNDDPDCNSEYRNKEIERNEEPVERE